MKHLPNALTIARIAVTPVLLVGLVSGTLIGYLVALVLFVLAAISDYWDGKLARIYGSHSRLGQFLDPLADKILVLGTLAALAWLHPQIVPWWAVALIAGRDFAVTAFRSVVEAGGRSLRTLPMAKTKTALQLTFLISVLTFLTLGRVPDALSFLRVIADWVLYSSFILQVLLYVLVLVTVGTGLMYAVKPQYDR